MWSPGLATKSFGANIRESLGFAELSDNNGESFGFTFATVSSAFRFGQNSQKFEVNV